MQDPLLCLLLEALLLEVLLVIFFSKNKSCLSSLLLKNKVKKLFTASFQATCWFSWRYLPTLVLFKKGCMILLFEWYCFRMFYIVVVLCTRWYSLQYINGELIVVYERVTGRKSKNLRDENNFLQTDYTQFRSYLFRRFYSNYSFNLSPLYPPLLVKHYTV